MTHSLHREGTVDSLERDYAVFIYPARGFNYAGSGPKVMRLMELLFLAGPSNMSVTTLRRNLYSGVPQAEFLASIKDGARVFSVFSDRVKVVEALRRLKEADEGISIVVSGLVDRAREMSAEVGLKPHTVNLSLGIHGGTDTLPPPDIRQFTTMCGHGLVSPKACSRRTSQIETGKANGLGREPDCSQTVRVRDLQSSPLGRTA
jgi:hypothetical protein